jgi:hypothetical protein
MAALQNVTITSSKLALTTEITSSASKDFVELPAMPQKSVVNEELTDQDALGSPYEETLMTPPTSPSSAELGDLYVPEKPSKKPDLPPRPAAKEDFQGPINQMHEMMLTTALPQSYRMCFTTNKAAFNAFYDVHKTLRNISGQTCASNIEELRHLAGWLKGCLEVIMTIPGSESTFSSVLFSEIVQCLKTTDDKPGLETTTNLTQLAGMVFRTFEKASFGDRMIVLVTLYRYFRNGGNFDDLHQWTDCIMKEEGKKRDTPAQDICTQDLGTQFAFLLQDKAPFFERFSAAISVYRRLVQEDFLNWARRTMQFRPQGRKSLDQDDIEREDGIPRWGE